MYNLNSYDFGKRLKKIRKTKEVSIEYLAKKINKAASTVYKYESNVILPDFLTVINIANVLGVNLEDFCNLEDSELRLKKLANPFETNKLYFYYRGFNGNLAEYEIEIETKNNQKNVYLKNVVKQGELAHNFYLGTIDVDNNTAYIVLKNNESINNRFEKLEIIVNLKTPSDGIYMGVILATNDNNNIPTVRKCMIVKDRIIHKENKIKAYDKLKLTEEEIKGILNKGYWDVDILNSRETPIVYLND